MSARKAAKSGRAGDLANIEDPICMASKAKRKDSMHARPVIETANPSRANDRSDMKNPIDEQSNANKAKSKREKDLRNNADSEVTWSRIDIVESARTFPYVKNAKPTR